MFIPRVKVSTIAGIRRKSLLFVSGHSSWAALTNLDMAVSRARPRVRLADPLEWREAAPPPGHNKNGNETESEPYLF